jgi:hypothetical protein
MNLASAKNNPQNEWELPANEERLFVSGARLLCNADVTVFETITWLMPQRVFRACLRNIISRKSPIVSRTI